MKNLTPYYFMLFFFILFSCSESKKEIKMTAVEKPIVVLPFQEMTLNDLSDFKVTAANWRITGGASVDRSRTKTLATTEGTGVLVNIPDKGKRGNLVTSFKHGDIEFECDVMMPVGSNSGIYFQSRYEIQLFDSWGVENPQHSDMGGIYQRWDETKEGKEGFEGFAPKVNAAKAPGLWQHLKVIFHAPRFDESGNKIKNARFEEVRLNGALVHQNVEVSGPTRGGSDAKEIPLAPLLIQGDHGPVALRNLKYKLYKVKKVQLADVVLKEFENALPLYPNLDSLTPIREVRTDSISSLMATGVRPQKLLSYVGKLKIPESGDYIFDYKLNRGGGALLIDKDTIISMNGNYSLDSLRVAKVNLPKGEVPFQLIYNKHVPWQIGFGLYVEGPGIQKHSLHASSSLNLPSGEVNPKFIIPLENEPIAQRGFWMHDGKKRTHCIAVGNPEGTHYAYDLESGALLQAWNGDFMDATKMWQGRGEKQLGVPAGFIVSMHGDPELADLKDEKVSWPNKVSDLDYKQLGYEFDSDGLPIFSYQMGSSKVFNKIIPSKENRGLNREIIINGAKDMWFKVADGSKIEQLPDGTYIVNNESYFIDFKDDMLESMVRNSGSTDELLVKIPAGEQELNYSIIW
ncbi:DUF1080 domain-containing protein [Maribacter algarum]|uniref:DUF1080 domain-containing protein n=1 Tax=Maribacter algarum (ex Zhang et al. 2020) TaxID=2578118 RepID=A0A5S3PI39_9FLAO|nr:family 16 glycoside hydrolase [Maribacter algarum]TMM53944.1 DUF1080 domain-containing protein [Maribacter algarum]